MNVNVGLVVLTHNPGALWPHWLSAVRSQALEVADHLVGLVVDSSSHDGTNFSSLPTDFNRIQIAADDFNHGKTRNLALAHLPSDLDLVVFMTQDALLANSQALSRLLAVFSDPAVACAYGRQLPHTDASPLAIHARLYNYPKDSHLTNLGEKPPTGLKTCFLSNSFAAYRVKDLYSLGGFPSDVILGEDMFVAARLLLSGMSVAYVSDACVFHSHNYSTIQEFRRYFDTGVFHARNPWLLDAFGSVDGEGLRFVRSEWTYLLSHAPWRTPLAMLHTVAKLTGYRLGRLERFWPVKFKRWCSMLKTYWS
ncbi:MAG: glycosyltransferase family 2 protein [Limnohabitans sp.]